MSTNGKPKITAIVRFDHTAVGIGRGLGRHDFKSLEALKEYAECRGYEINVTHAHPAGVSIKRDYREEAIIPVLRTVCMGGR